MLMNRCRSEKNDTTVSGRTWKIILKFEERRVPDRNANGRKVEGEKRRVTRKECKRLMDIFEVWGFMAQKGLWIIAKKGCWRTEELCPKKRETNKAMHDENFLSSWLRMDVEGKGEKGTQ